MASSPLSASPYEILGVSRTATEDELKRAYRAQLRSSHPDTGGDATRFHAVQRAWELIGTPEARADYDRGRSPSGSSSSSSGESFAPRSRQATSQSRPLARTYGHPGGWRRERYLTLIREWVGRGVEVPDPFDAQLVRGAPRDIRHILADAVAEEATARIVSELGIAFTVWHDVATDASARPRTDDASKLDHIVLGPSGLFAVLSEDWGSPVSVKRGELLGEGIPQGERPLHSLAVRAKSVARFARVSFTAIVIVVPDDALEQSFIDAGKMRGFRAVVVQRSMLGSFMRNGLGGDPIGGNELFDARTRLQSTVRFV